MSDKDDDDIFSETITDEMESKATPLTNKPQDELWSWNIRKEKSKLSHDIYKYCASIAKDFILFGLFLYYAWTKILRGNLADKIFDFIGSKINNDYGLLIMVTGFCFYYYVNKKYK